MANVFVLAEHESPTLHLGQLSGTASGSARVDGEDVGVYRRPERKAVVLSRTVADEQREQESVGYAAGHGLVSSMGLEGTACSRKVGDVSALSKEGVSGGEWLAIVLLYSAASVSFGRSFRGSNVHRRWRQGDLQTARH